MLDEIYYKFNVLLNTDSKLTCKNETVTFYWEIRATVLKELPLQAELLQTVCKQSVSPLY